MASAVGPNGYSQQGDNTQGYNPTSTQQQTGSPSQPPDQVGWYFVESYYTTLNKTPERLALFYNKRSTFVWGTEGETLPTTQGRVEIGAKINSLEFKDCKVRVTNVDSQRSADKGIIIQVMGEMSNDNEYTSRKFVQTFFLAEQPNGYFVLNDMLRYLKDNEDDQFVDEPNEEGLEQEEVPVEATQEETPIEEPIQEPQESKAESEPEIEQEVVAPKAEEPAPIAPAVPEIPAAVPAVNGTPAPEPEPEAKVEEPAPAPASEPLPAPTKPEPTVATPAQPTPVATPPPPPAAAKELPAPVPAAPVVKGTWASLLASKSSAPAPAAQPAVPTAAPATPQATTAPPAPPATPTTSSGWQTAADSSRRHTRPQSISNAGDNQTQAYVKNVTDAVNVSLLKDALLRFGPLKHFEAVKQKNCAFVEFETPSAFQAAKLASPLRVGDVSVLVEERRQASARLNGPGGYGSNPRSPAGGPRGGDQRGGSQGRGGFQRVEGSRYEGRGGAGGSRGGRGGFTPRGRGSAGSPA